MVRLGRLHFCVRKAAPIVGSLLGSKASLTKRRTREDYRQVVSMEGSGSGGHGGKSYFTDSSLSEQDQLDAAARLGSRSACCVAHVVGC